MYIIKTPAKYMQGKNLINDLGEHAKDYGKRFLIISGKTALRLKKQAIEESFAANGLEAKFEQFGGESTMEEIIRMKELAEKENVDCIVGMGGGKALDTAKSAAFRVEKPVIIIPTIAASDAPCSCESIIYNDAGEVVDFEMFPTNPNLVLVDTEIIANAPTHTLVAGIGDALATYIEARTCYETGSLNVHGTNILEAAYALSKLCYDILMEYGVDAKKASDMNKPTRALEKVIEANIYLSGLGFENGGLSCAHAIHDALTMIPECHQYMHGYKVAFGNLCHLVLEGRPEDEIEAYINLSTVERCVVTLEQVGICEDIEEKSKDIS